MEITITKEDLDTSIKLFEEAENNSMLDDIYCSHCLVGHKINTVTGFSGLVDGDHYYTNYPVNAIPLPDPVRKLVKAFDSYWRSGKTSKRVLGMLPMTFVFDENKFE